jgi:transcriptional regulator with XRE-family HTH domain
MTTLAARIKRTRTKRGFTATELAKKIGLKEASYMYRLENADFKIENTKYILQLAKALRVDPDWLQNGDRPQACPAAVKLTPEAELTSRNKALSALSEEQQAKIEALLADNAMLAEAKSKLAEELEALRDENIALAKEAINAATSITDDKFLSLVNDLFALLRLADVTDNNGVDSKTLRAVIKHHNLEKV